MKLKPPTAGITFTQHVPKHQTLFERLFEVFKELITHTSGDFDEAINWLRELSGTPLGPSRTRAAAAGLRCWCGGGCAPTRTRPMAGEISRAISG